MAKKARARVWIDRQIQGAIAFRVAVHWCCFASLASVVTFAMQYVADPFAPLPTQVQRLCFNQGPFLLVILVLLPVFVYDTIKLSNRFAGPILRLRRVMQAIGRGEPAEKLVFRGNDFWRGLATDFNKLVERGYFEAGREVADENHRRDLQEVS